MAWEQEFRGHELWASVKTTLEATSRVEPENNTSKLARLRAVLTEIGGHEDQPHPALTNSHLTEVKGIVDKVGSCLPESPDAIFSSPSNNRNGPSLFGQLAQKVRAWPATGSTSLRGLGKQAEQVEESFRSLNTRLDERLTEVEDQASARSRNTSELLEQLREDLAEQRESFEALVAEKTSELNSKLGRLQELAADADSTIEQQKKRLDSALESQQERFSAAQEDRTEKWSSLIEDNDAKLREHLQLMKEHEEQSQNVLSAVGVNATATDYGSYANEQATVADKWRIGALIALSIAALAFLGVAGASFLGIGTDLDWWQVVFQKLGAPAGAAAVGYVLIRESGQHRKEERSARQVQLTLTALEPFIANLPDIQKERIRVETAQRIFAEQNAPSKASAQDAEVETGLKEP